MSLIAGEEEREHEGGIALGLYHLPGAKLQAHTFTQQDVEAMASPEDWHQKTGISNGANNGWLVFADPFTVDCDAWLRSWDAAYSPVPTLGGLASGDPMEQRTQVYLNSEVLDSGGVALSIGGDVALEGVISQGCTPIGESWTITKAENNLIHKIANRPAYDVLLDTFNTLSSELQARLRGNLFVGLVTNEYQEEYHRGDFLIRNLLAADPKSGTIAVSALPRTGQAIQFQSRDASTATDDLAQLLEAASLRIGHREIYGGCLCSCNGRGRSLFGRPDHDASLVQKHLGPLGLTGFFCNGEIGPVGGRSFLHGYTASLALFVSK